MDSTLRHDLEKLRQAEAASIALFLDDGGVLNDNALRGPEWQRLIGEFMPPRLGGSPERWAETNPIVFRRVWGDVSRRIGSFSRHETFHRTYALGWMHGMCDAMGLACPPDDEALVLYNQLAVYIGERAAAAIPGAAEAVLALDRAGYVLFTASGTPSWELQAIQTRLGIASVYTGLYGPDVVDYVKHGPGFYRAVFAHAGVAPGAAVVIDSDLECCEWANEAGAQSVWIDLEGRGDAETLATWVRALLNKA